VPLARFTVASLLISALYLPIVLYLVIVFGDSIGVGSSAYVAGGLSVVVADFYTLSINTLRAGQRSVTFGAAQLAPA